VLHSKFELHTNLEYAGIVRRGHLPELAIAEIGVHRQKIDVIEYVERIAVQLEAEVFANSEDFKQRRIPVFDPRTTHQIFRGIAKEAVGRVRIRRRIEELRNCLRTVQRLSSYDIGTRRQSDSWPRQSDIDGSPALKLNDSRQLPAAEDLSGQALRNGRS